MTFIHAPRADIHGNVLLKGIVGVQKEAVLAAKRAVVTVEEVVDDFCEEGPNAVVLPHWTVTVDRGRARRRLPELCARILQTQQRVLHRLGRRSRADRETFLDWMKANVLEQGPEAFAAHAAKLILQGAAA